ncbi:hypothetical protein BSLG_005361 [Batrachochytrium salamandrivorans]|nr:hypothetical protein BSLG_005361 [Batrachochytrium salamandrivorans]
MTSLLEIRQDPVKGRCFFTTKPICAGQIVLESHAYAFVVDHESLSVVCSNCHQPPTLVAGAAMAQDKRQPLPFSCASVWRPHACEEQANHHHHHAAASRSTAGIARGGGASMTDSDHNTDSVMTHSSSSSSKAVVHDPTADCCRRLRYCSLECAQTDYERFHRFECDQLRVWFNDPNHYLTNSSSYEQDYSRLMLRIITRLGWESRNNKSGVHQDPTTTTTTHQQQNAAERTKTPSQIIPWINSFVFNESVWPLCDNVRSFPLKRLNLFKPLAILLASFVTNHPLHPDLPAVDPALHEYLLGHGITSSTLESLMMLLICKEECNSFGVYTFNYTGNATARQSYGVGVYPTAVFFNHSCHPSIGHVTRSLPDRTVALDGNSNNNNTNNLDPALVPLSMHGSTMLFFANRDLEANAEALIAYLPLEGSLAQRQATIRDSFYFECGCERCSVPLTENQSSSPVGSVSLAASTTLSSAAHIAPDTTEADLCHGVIGQLGLRLCLQPDCHGWLVPQGVGRCPDPCSSSSSVDSSRPTVAWV